MRFPEEIVLFDINSIEKNENSQQKTDFFSLVIKLETDEKPEEKELIYTYCSIKFEEKKAKLEVLKQKIEFPDKALLMHEIYGFNSKESKEKFFMNF